MRLNMPRDFYMPKADDLKLVDCQGTDAAVFTYSAVGKPYAIGFHGKAAKPDFHCWFGNEAKRDEYIARFIEGRKQHAHLRFELKAERSKPHTLKVGDILDCSWGYDQTNVDYYQVTRIVSGHSVEIRKIASESVPNSGYKHGMADNCLPIKDAFIGKPMIKRANSTNSVRIASFAYADLWDGKANYRSWYA